LIRVLFILENYYPNIGGVETLFKSLAESLVKKGFKVQILTNRFDKSLLKHEIHEGVEIIRLPLRNRYLFSFFAGLKAIPYARQNDIVHTTSYNAALPAFIAFLFTGKKTVITFHEVWGRLWFKLPFMNRFALFLHYCFEQFILRLPYQKFIAVSQSTKTRLIESGIKESKIEMIYNGIDYSQFSIPEKKPHKRFRFCYFGRLGISKGLDLLLDATALINNKNIDFELLLILPKEPAAFLDTILKIIEKKNITDRIIIKQELPFQELLENVSASDAVVIPSYSEGFCFTAVETMALGVPIISSGQGALHEVVGGKHLQMKNLSAEALAECMLKAIDSEWSMKEAQRFDLEESTQAYIRMYESLI